MKTWLRISLALLIWGGVVGSGCSELAAGQPASATAAIQAIQQAPDPSAVVAAYGSGLAVAPNDPKLHGAYVARMVDMGLPEMAYHQAQTVTTLEPNNGLAWGVVAYVDARRGQMPEAVAAINLAGQFAPTNKFIAHTAGEILAWYDLKADQAMLPANAKDGLTRLRGLVGKDPAYTEAYDTARKAYQAQTSTTQPSAPGAATGTAAAAAASGTSSASTTPQTAYAPQATAVPPPGSPYDEAAASGYAPPAVVPVYVPDYYPSYYDLGPDYCYDWGADWIAPTPWYWWQPCGFWSGCSFFPFGGACVFGNYNDFHHYAYGRGYDHDHDFDHHGGFGHGNDPAVWHHGSHGTASFFGTPSRANSSLTRWNRQGLQGTSSLTAARMSTSGAGSAVRGSLWAGSGTAHQWWSGTGQSRAAAAANPASRSIWTGTAGGRSPISSGGTIVARNDTRSRQGIWSAEPFNAARPSASLRAPAVTAPATRPWTGTYRGYSAAPATRFSYAAPAYRAPAYRAPAYTAPRYAAPSIGSFHTYRSAPSFARGWSRSVPTYSAPAVRSFGGGSSFHPSGGGFSGGHFSGGGFHGGGFGGGGHGGRR